MLFNDASALTKSTNCSMTMLASTIVELPPLLRNSKNNLIVHSLWTGNIDINTCLEKYNKEINELINEGLFIAKYNQILNFRIIGLLADSVGRPKISYSTQFNGAFGCPYCQNPGLLIIILHFYC